MRHTAILLLVLLSVLPVQAQQVGRVQADGAKVYETPSDTSAVRYSLPKGIEVDIVGHVGDFYTVQVQSRDYSTSGFMRKSEVFLAGRRERTAQIKDPGTATLLSVLVTGAGHMYAGEGGTGALLFVSGVAAPLMGYFATSSSVDVNCSGYSCEDNTNWAPLYVGVGVGALAHLIGIIDSGSAARRHNREHGVALAPTVERPGLALRVEL